MPLSVSSGRRHNVLDLSVRPSVRSSVTNLMYTIFWKEMNRFWYKLPKVVYEGHERIILGSEGQRSGGNAVVMRKSWFKAPASSSGRRGEKPYLRFPPPAGSPDQLPPRGTPPRATTVRYSICRLNAGSGGEDPDEPPDCLYGLQVRGPPFSLGGSLFWGAVGAFRSGGRLCYCRFLCAGRYIALLIEHEWGGPQHRLMGALSFRGSCSWVGERKGSWAVGYLCSCSKCAVTRHLEQ